MRTLRPSHLDHLIWTISFGLCVTPIAGPSEIGVATPYAGQVNYDLTVLRKVQKDRPDNDWRSLRFGTTEWFMGRKALYMIVDLVRGSNDHGELGFMSEGRRLNVLLPR